MDPITVQVRHKRPEALNIASYELARPDGAPLPRFSAGAHVDVRLPGGLTRQYSLCNDDCQQASYRIAVLRDANSRGGSAAMHDAVSEGDLLQISAPRNLFPLVPARRTLLFAGGIGVTPLLSMARRLHALGADFQLHYSTRSRAHAAFRDEILASGFAGRVAFHHDDEAEAQRLDAHAALGAPADDVHVYVCGPQGFIAHVQSCARALGWPESQVHVEHFAAAPAALGGDRPFQVMLASNGQRYDVPAGVTVVQALATHGIAIQVSCEQGICGTCMTGVLAGECEHRDMYLTDDEKSRHDQFMPCCSRAGSALLVLDL